MPADTIVQQFADFALKARFEDLPPSIVYETKMILMDAVGCALVATQTDKGKINLSLAKRFGGPADASVIGSGFKVGLSTATTVNGELMYTPDYISMIAGGNPPSRNLRWTSSNSSCDISELRVSLSLSRNRSLLTRNV